MYYIKKILKKESSLFSPMLKYFVTASEADAVEIMKSRSSD